MLQADLNGTVVMKALLSGMPECRIALNDKIALQKEGKVGRTAVDLDDLHFHQCVRLTTFDAERIITFIPPDGDFELLTYDILFILLIDIDPLKILIFLFEFSQL